MVAILADHRVDHDLITGQALLDDPWRQRRRDHSLFLARLASTLLAFADHARSTSPAPHPVGNSPRSRSRPSLSHSLGRRIAPAYSSELALPAEGSRAVPAAPDAGASSLPRAGTAGRSLSAWTSALLTPGSSSSNSSCASESFSLPGPYFAMRTSRSRSSSTRIFSSAYCSLF